VEIVNRKLIVILGMHRSGTSAITRALQVMSVNLGSNLMPPVEGVNPKGFWEDIDLNALNIEMLTAIGLSWDSLSIVTPAMVDKLIEKGYQIRALEMLAEKIELYGVFGFKDPRVTKLLPFWLKVFDGCDFPTQFVVSIRNPMSVVESLKKRDDFDREKSYLLWLESVVRSLVVVVDFEVVLIDYDNLISSPVRELSKISAMLGLNTDLRELEEYTSNFLKNNLRNTKYSIEQLKREPNVPMLVKEVYVRLSEYTLSTQSSFSPEMKSLFTRWRDDLNLLSLYLSLHNMENDELRLNIDALNDELRLNIDALDEQIIGLNQLVVKQDEQVDGLITEKKYLYGLIEEEKFKFKTILNSSSWKLTKPLREVRRWVSSPSQQFKRYSKAGLFFGKRVFYALPINNKTKAILRSVFLKYYFKLITKTKVQNNLWTPQYGMLPSFQTHEDFAKTITISHSLAPLVSVIIPVYGEIGFTLQCLASIAANTPSVDFEVVIVDDCSPDNTATILEFVRGVTLVKNNSNKGFIGACNIGANIAKGEYLYFLNNDTEVTNDWMDALLQSFHDFPGTGFVGSKLIYPDGRLQEAGGIIWKDGSAWNFGKLQDPSLPIYNYAREVDYCSGASIMVPRFLFEKLGGFDSHYAPAYCEDADLALKIRDQGYRVIYQPMSTIIHYEGITSGTDVNGAGAKSYQVENMKKLFTRWQGRLSKHQIPGEMIDQAKDRMATRRVLVIDHCTPKANQDAGSVIVFNQMLLLREMGFQVTFIAEDNLLYIPEYTNALQKVGVEVLYKPYIFSVKDHLKKFGSRYDLAFLYRSAVMERHANTLRRYCPKIKLLFSPVDLHFLRMKREAELKSDNNKLQAAELMKLQEYRAFGEADATIVHSTIELQLLLKDFPKENIHLFPLVLDVTGSDVAFSQRKDVVFVGGYDHSPNVDAVQYFVADIMPGLRERLPNVRFHVVGSNVPKEIKVLACDDVLITGFVDELGPLLDSMRVSVAPIRFGAGIKGKIGSAMVAGLPVVASSVAVEGMSLSHGQNVLVADSVDNYIDMIAMIYESESLWQTISTNALTFSKQQWGIDSAWKSLSTILSSMQFDTIRGELPLSLHRDKKVAKRSE